MQKQVRKASFVQTMRAVAWSFLGIRKRSEFEKDVSNLNPLHIIAVGAVMGVAFVVGLALFVRWVVAV